MSDINFSNWFLDGINLSTLISSHTSDIFYNATSSDAQSTVPYIVMAKSSNCEYCVSSCTLTCQYTCDGQCSDPCESSCQDTCEKCQICDYCEYYCTSCDYSCEGCTDPCQSCQYCLSCQDLCEVGKQIVAVAIGYEYEADWNLMVSTEWNGLVNYIQQGLDIAKSSLSIQDCTITPLQIITPTEFNKINDAVNTFIDAATGISERQIGDVVTKSDMTTIVNELSTKAKVPTGIPCCETAGESCITVQKI